MYTYMYTEFQYGLSSKCVVNHRTKSQNFSFEVESKVTTTLMEISSTMWNRREVDFRILYIQEVEFIQELSLAFEHTFQSELESLRNSLRYYLIDTI